MNAFTMTKSGSNHTFVIENGQSLRSKMPSRVACFDGENGKLTVRATNKREAAEVEMVIKSNEAVIQPAPASVTSKKQRRVVLASNSNGLETGRPWYCTASNVDEMQLPPQWEGELICYAYN